MSITDILGLAGNAATGGVLGILGSVGTGIVSIFQSKTQFKHDETMATFRIEEVRVNAEAQSKMSADQLKATIEKGSSDAFAASQVSLQSASFMVNFFREILTVILIIFTLWFYNKASQEIQDFILRSYVIAGTTAISFWFGSRQLENFIPSKNYTPSKK
jgi:hypothetical protein